MITYATKRQLLKMCHLRHRLRICLFRKKTMFRFKDIQVFCIFNHSMIHQICNVMMIISIYIRQGAFLNISFEQQPIKSPKLAN